MNFVKGAMLGIIAGTVVGVMNSNNIKDAMYVGKKQLRKFQKKYIAH